MYQDFFGLREKPFALLPDPRFLYLSRCHREALAHLMYGIEQGEGFIEVVGQVGTGKTTLCRTLLERIGASAETAYIFNPSRTEAELLAAINREFGLPTAARSRAQLIDQLNAFLLEKRTDNRRVLLVIDEAQNLSRSTLEEVRLLSNLETPTAKLLQIILVGQPELSEVLARPELRQLRQRVVLRHHLRPFDAKELEDYVDERLSLAGYTGGGIFKRAARKELFRVTGGVPRLVNIVCDGALLGGYARGLTSVGAELIEEVARELQLSGEDGEFSASPGAGTAAKQRKRGWFRRRRR